MHAVFELMWFQPLIFTIFIHPYHYSQPILQLFCYRSQCQLQGPPQAQLCLRDTVANIKHRVNGNNGPIDGS